MSGGSLSVDDITDLYWDLDIPVKEIIEAAGLNHVHELLEYVTPLFVDVICTECGGQLYARSRSGYQSVTSSRFRPATCHDCVGAFAERRLVEMEEKQAQRERLIQNLRSMPYREYLQTEHWANVRKDALKRAGYSCQVCNSSGRLDAHHRTYKNLGCENYRDVIALCRSCHTTFHKNNTFADWR